MKKTLTNLFLAALLLTSCEIDSNLQEETTNETTLSTTDTEVTDSDQSDSDSGCSNNGQPTSNLEEIRYGETYDMGPLTLTISHLPEQQEFIYDMDYNKDYKKAISPLVKFEFFIWFPHQVFKDSEFHWLPNCLQYYFEGGEEFTYPEGTITNPLDITEFGANYSPLYFDSPIRIHISYAHVTGLALEIFNSKVPIIGYYVECWWYDTEPYYPNHQK